MPTVPTHALSGCTIVMGGSRWKAPASLSIAGALSAALPDIDVLSFRLGVPHGSLLAHRGLTHSLAFAAVLSLLIVSTGAFRRVGRGTAWLYLFACMASHGLLDAATDGGRGIALFAPFSYARYFWEVRPIAVSPIGIRAFFSHGGSAVIASELRWVWLPCVAALALTYVLRRARTAPPAQAETVSSMAWIDVIACTVIVICAVWLRPYTTWWFAGVGLFVVTFPLWIAARVQLGDAFSVRAEPRSLVTRGLYARVRHPIYLFGTVAFFGAFLALQVWWLLLVWLALTPIEIIRLRREERRLREKYGNEYDRYRAGTWI